ncbi:sugar phosphate isomerase/epimerase family protein [Leptolyngbya sp. AN02str]|uniref:sugar phosphate isomerase/epimerase family protein n=1 Tax=Leptolyngbya sp. AN02str TaxID=3423363 RepID=UPI003D317F32
MKLTVSNIAWPDEVDETILSLLADRKVAAIEVAPTRISPDWQLTADVITKFRNRLEEQGLQCSSLQAILYACPDLKVFGGVDTKAKLVQHLKRVADLAAQLGARPLVFGAPKNRLRGPLSETDAFAQAVDLFQEVGQYCADLDVCLCIEPNPTLYGCDFVTHSAQGAELVRAVNSPGFRLHLDVAGMYLAGEDIPRSLDSCMDVLEHIHISEPHLGSFAEPVIDHASVAASLHTLGWTKWISIEMRATEQPIQGVEKALDYVMQVYGA